jgi:hypothetical protein
MDYLQFLISCSHYARQKSNGQIKLMVNSGGYKEWSWPIKLQVTILQVSKAMNNALSNENNLSPFGIRTAPFKGAPLFFPLRM